MITKELSKDNILSNTNSKKEHIVYLDFLRSYAIIMVVILHAISDYIILPELYGTVSWYVNIILNAFVRTGVPIFFMISGYLILSSDKTRDFRTFYKKRMLKILIPLAVWNIIYYIFANVYAVLTQTQGMTFFNFCSSIVNIGSKYHLWYLYTTLGLYLISPYLKIIIDKCSNKQLFFLVMIMMLCTTFIPAVNFFSPHAKIYLFDPLFNGYIGCFLLGYLLGTINLRRSGILVLNTVAVISVVISVVMNHIYSSKEGINLVMNNGYNICHFIIACVIFLNMRYSVKSGCVFNKIATFISSMSFGIYLVHPMIQDLIKLYVLPQASPVVETVFLFISIFSVSLLLTYGYHKCINLGEIYDKFRKNKKTV